MMVLFHNIESGNKGNKLKSWLLLLSIFLLDCIGLAYGAVTWWMNNSEKPEDSKDSKWMNNSKTTHH